MYKIQKTILFKSQALHQANIAVELMPLQILSKIKVTTKELVIY